MIIIDFSSCVIFLSILVNDEERNTKGNVALKCFDLTEEEN